MKGKELQVVWIVDDDTMYRNFIGGHLKLFGYNTIHFSCGEDCLSQLHTLPDLIILDHNLGDGINGLETLQRIKEINAGIPVVYLSAQDDLSSAVQALKLGVFDYIEKDDSAVVRLKNNIDKIREINTVLKKRYQSQVRILVLTAIACFAIIISLLYFLLGK